MTENLPATRDPMPPATASAEPKEVFVVARDPAEMRTANAELIRWAEARVLRLIKDRDEMHVNYEIAVKSKWRSEPLKRAEQTLDRQVSYYDKILSALKAGYYIVPNFPIDLFAIRTTRREPTGHNTQDRWVPNLADQQTHSPKTGEGRYVSPAATVERDSTKITNEKGETFTRHEVWATGWNDVEFPIAFAKPAVLDATRQAMALRLFDEIGVCRDQMASRGGDPMVIGRVLRKQGYQTKAVSFVVAWFLDTAKI